MNNKFGSFILKNIMMLLVAGFFLVAGFLLGRKSSPGDFSTQATDACTLDRPEEVHCTDEYCGPEQGANEHSDHGHGTEAADLDELEKMRCEHNVSIVDCDECRYEVGVVRVDPAVAASLIETGLVKDVDWAKILTFTGQVQLDCTKAVDVVPTGGGRVEQVQKFLGDTVQKGDVLALIHSDDLGQAKANFLEKQASLELAETIFNREKDLYEQKISSQVDYLAARNALKAAQASYAAVDKKLRLFGLDTEQIETIKDEEANGSFGNLVLRAPRAGILIAQNITLGQIVDTKQSVYTIADLSNLWVWCDVYEKDLAILLEETAKNEPLKATVKVNAFESNGFNGEVDFIGNLMDEHTRTVKMRVQVKNPEHKLRPGMFADVQVSIGMDNPIQAIPKTAVMTDAGEDFVFQHWKDDLWVRRDVAVGRTHGNFVELFSGLPQGAKIVTGGAFMLKSDVLREKMGAGCAD